MVALFDTPGMEDAIALLEYVDSLAPPAEHIEGPKRIERFLASPSAATRFEQEAKVLRQLLASDAGLYVVDARDPVLAKHRDELSLLTSCARPLLPVLNFVNQPESREAGVARCARAPWPSCHRQLRHRGARDRRRTPALRKADHPDGRPPVSPRAAHRCTAARGPGPARDRGAARR